MTTISPARTSRSTPLTAIWRRSSRTKTSLRRKHDVAWLGGPFDHGSSTSRPTIRLASCLATRSAGCRARDRPRRSTTMPVSDLQDLVELVGDEDDRRAAGGEHRMMPNSSSVSCGVSTALGSSSTRMSLFRYSAFMISTRWRTPTGRSSIFASGLTSRLYCSDSSTMRWRAAARSNVPSGPHTVSAPSATASTTSKTGRAGSAGGPSRPGVDRLGRIVKRTGLVRRSGSRRSPADTGQTGCSSASSCRRRFRRACRGLCRGQPRSRSGRWRGRPGIAS